MQHIQRSILLLICLTVLFASFVGAQEKISVFNPNRTVTVSLSKSEKKLFGLVMKENDFAEINWLSNESLSLTFSIYDSSNKIWLEANSADDESIVFVAPKDGEYTLSVKFDASSEVSGTQNITLQYNNKFKLPTGTKLKDVRKINGYDVKIMSAPEVEYGGEDSFVLINKGAILKKVLKAGSGRFSFPDDIREAYSAQAKKAISLVKNTPDKTGDGISDIMINHFSGGAHCCFATHFINLGEIVETVEIAYTGNAELNAYGKNPKGGLIFETHENGFTYWLTSFAQSPLPRVVLEFRNGKLRPNFELMKKPAPTLNTLKRMAQVARNELSLEAYRGEDNENSVLYREDIFPKTVFWGTMLDLIYTGNEDLAWQFLDLVWDTRKQGKQLFIRDFKKQLAESEYWKMIEEGKGLNK